MNCARCQALLPDDSRYCPTCGADQSDPGAGPRPSTSVTDMTGRLARALEGRYRVTKMLGRGGMGAVFLAEDLTLERPVAIKLLPPDVAHDGNVVERFEREARTAARLDHPNIIPIFAVEGIDDLHFFVMKFVGGEPLDSVLKRGPLPLATGLQYVWEAAAALGHAHRRGVVHRDVKPANIMLDHDGRIMLTDFGISKAMQSATQLTGTGQVIGTPHYMSPEQARGEEVDGRSDQYSLACVAYQVVTGRLPFEDDSIHALIFKHVQSDPPSLRDLNPDTPPFVATAIHRALAKSPDDRFENMEAFAQAICPDRRLSLSVATGGSSGRASDHASAKTEIASSAETVLASSPTRRRGRAWLGAAVVIVALGSGGAWAWQSGWLPDALGSAGPEASASDPVASDPPPAAGVDSTTLAGGLPADSGPVEPDTAATPPARTEPVQSTPPRQTTPRTTPATPPPAAPRVGYLTVDATPWGTVFVNDVEIGDTPVVRHELAAGRYVVRIVQSNCRDWVDTVTVTVGGNRRERAVLTCGGSRP